MKCGNSMRHVLEGESDAVKVLDATLLICNHSVSIFRSNIIAKMATHGRKEDQETQSEKITLD